MLQQTRPRVPFAVLALILAVVTPTATALGELPEKLTTSAEMAAQLQAIADADGRFQLETIGQSVAGQDLLAVRVTPAQRMAIRWKVLFIGAQHGDEHAGKEAILELLADLATGNEDLPPGVEIWAVPMANPDGNDRDARRNANDFDLNRDHLILSQPETIALHRLVQRERPHVIVDCHEFTRDSKSYTDKGWGEWPLIMMDGANSPLIHPSVGHWTSVTARAVGGVMKNAGINYQRYTLGGPPPWRELRFSTFDTDDARNGLSFYDGLGFIIESGVKRAEENPQADLAERVAAYRILLDWFIVAAEQKHDPYPASRWRTLNDQQGPPSLPHTIDTNAFWSMRSHRVTQYPVIDLASGKTLQISTVNFANERTFKRRVATPASYAVIGRYADHYADMLDKHAVNYERLHAPRTVSAELATLDRLEEDFDPVYERYGGRQIVSVEAEADYELPAGSLWIDLAQLAETEPMMARRAIKVLEPQQLYGLYQWPQWRATVADDGTIPVVRVMAD